jgi:hypothetical protein
MTIAPFGDAYEKIGTIQRRLAWPLHKDDTLFQSGRPTGLNIYFTFFLFNYHHHHSMKDIVARFFLFSFYSRSVLYWIPIVGSPRLGHAKRAQYD